MMKNLSQMLQKAQEMQSKMGDMQAKMADVHVEGVAGGGMVRVTLSAQGDMKGVKIDPSLMGEDVEMLEDLIKAAHTQAKGRAQAAMEEAMKDITGGMPLPEGFKMPF